MLQRVGCPTPMQRWAQPAGSPKTSSPVLRLTPHPCCHPTSHIHSAQRSRGRSCTTAHGPCLPLHSPSTLHHHSRLPPCISPLAPSNSRRRNLLGSPPASERVLGTEPQDLPSPSSTNGNGTAPPSEPRPLPKTHGAAKTASPSSTPDSSSRQPQPSPLSTSSQNSDAEHHHHHHQHQQPKLFYGSMTPLQVLRSFAYRSLLLFLVGGSAISWLLVAWARGSSLQLRHPYTFSVSFPVAPSLEAGVPLRIKGVQVGSVVEAHSGLEYVEAVVEVNQRTMRIPRSSVMVYNKAGPLSPAPFIDVQLPKELPKEQAGSQDRAATGADPAASEQLAAMPLSLAAAAEGAQAAPDEQDACRAEGLLLCAGDRVQGLQGGGMDELTALMLKSMKEGVEAPEMLPPVMREVLLAQKQAAAARAARDL